MGKIIITVFLFIFSVSINAQNQVPTKTQQLEQQIQQQQQLEQQKAGSWVQDWWENVQHEQSAEIFDEEEKELCERKLIYYKNKTKERSDSRYYELKLEKWTKRCIKYEKVDKPTE